MMLKKRSTRLFGVLMTTRAARNYQCGTFFFSKSVNGLMDGLTKTDGTEFIEYYSYRVTLIPLPQPGQYQRILWICYLINRSERRARCLNCVTCKIGDKRADAAGEKPTRAGSLFQRIIFRLIPRNIIIQEGKFKKKSQINLKGYRSFLTVRGDNGGLWISCLSSFDPVLI